MYLVKLGGSAITCKNKYRAFRAKDTRRLVEELASSQRKIVLVHGAGSFGHILARKGALQHGVQSSSQLRYVAEVQRDVRLLNLRILDCMIDAGLRPVSFPPSTLITLRRGKVIEFNTVPITRSLNDGLLPVLFGDVVPDTDLKYSICSGDLIMAQLTSLLKPRLAVFVTDVNGIYNTDPQLDRSAKLIPELSARELSLLIPHITSGKIMSIKPQSSKDMRLKTEDVTGGMENKLKSIVSMAQQGTECMVLNGLVKDRTFNALTGRKDLWTRVIPDGKSDTC